MIDEASGKILTELLSSNFTGNRIVKLIMRKGLKIRYDCKYHFKQTHKPVEGGSAPRSPDLKSSFDFHSTEIPVLKQPPPKAQIAFPLYSGGHLSNGTHSA